MFVIMDQPWYRKLFRHPGKLQLEDPQSEAEHGDAEAQFSLGFRFANGAGRAPDYAQAAQWYLRAASQNHSLAQFNLAIMLAGGQGVPQDDASALMWMQKAARQGDAGAQHNLGLRHRRASFAGLPQDALESNLEAYKWFRLAAAQGYRDSDTEFAGVAIGMTRDQVIEGDQRAAAFTALCANPTPA
jgi:TPR repeat protein